VCVWVTVPWEPQGKARAFGKDKQKDRTLSPLICTCRDHRLALSGDKGGAVPEKGAPWMGTICVREETQYGKKGEKGVRPAENDVTSLLHFKWEKRSLSNRMRHWDRAFNFKTHHTKSKSRVSTSRVAQKQLLLFFCQYQL